MPWKQPTTLTHIVAGTFAQVIKFVFSSENQKIYFFSCLYLLLHIYIVYNMNNNHASTVIYFFIILTAVLQLLWQPKVTCFHDNWSCRSNPSPCQSHGSTYCTLNRINFRDVNVEKVYVVLKTRLNG